MTEAHRAKLEPVSGNTRETRPANNSYFPALDGLRAVAFLMVFALHYLSAYLPVSFGWAGVDVFFVLSGFLITGILYDTRDAPFRFHNFYLRRTMRIFPLYYGVFLLLALFYPLCHWQWNWGWLAWPAYLGNFAVFFRSAVSSVPGSVAGAELVSTTFPKLWLNLGHFWTLCVEEQFYLFWPLAVFAIKDRRKLIYFCIPFLILCPLLRIYADHFLPTFALQADALNYATVFHLDALLLGAVIALVRRGPAAKYLPTIARSVLTIIAVVVVLWLLLNPAARHTPPGYVMPLWRLNAKVNIADLISAGIIIMALEYRSITFRLLNQAPLRWLGRISYGAYVFHAIPHLWFLHLLQPYFRDPGLPTAALAFVFTLVLSSASFRYFETPFIRLKDRYTKRSAVSSRSASAEVTQ